VIAFALIIQSCEPVLYSHLDHDFLVDSFNFLTSLETNNFLLSTVDDIVSEFKN
jgi:hypothetical protein